MCGSPLHRPMIPNREIGKAGFRIFSFVAVCRLPLLLDDDGRENRPLE